MSDDILSRYPDFRDRPVAMAMFCSVLRARGLHADAYKLGQAAITAAPGSMAVRDEVRGTLAVGVDRFHIPMLHDDARNKAYARAIERAVEPGMKVLEIGTGAGLLALIAARAGAQVTTCEANPVIAAAATEVVARNGLADRIRVVSGLSSKLQPEDLGEPADLLIHEIFGNRMVNENVVAALSDARLRLLKPGAPALPARSCVRCALVGMARPAHIADLATVEGFDLSAFNLLSYPFRQTIQPGAKGVDARSAPASALRLDFDAAPPFGPKSETVTLVSLGGQVDGVAQWLELDFGNGDTFENDPLAEGPGSSWAAPVAPLPDPIQTRPGDLIDVTFRHRGMMMTIEAIRR